MKKITSTLLLVLATSLIAQTVSAQNTVVHITKRNASGFAIDGNNGAANAQSVYLWEQDSSNVNQQWVEINRGGEFYSYQKQGTNHCLDGGRGGANGQDVYLWECSSGNRNQHWRKVSTDNGFFQLRKRNAQGFAIDGGSGGSNAQNVALYDSSNRSANLQWRINTIRSGGNNQPSPTASNCPGTFDLPACMERTANRGGGTIVLAAQTYQLSDSLRLRDNVNIVGQGKDTVIRFTNAVADRIDDPLLEGLGVNNIELKDFTLRCSIDQDPRSNDIRNDHMGIYIDGPGDPANGERTDNNNVRMERIEAYHCSNGMHLKGLTGFIGVDLDLHDNGNTERDLFHNIYLLRVANIHMAQTGNNTGGFYASNRGHGLRLSRIGNAYFGNLSVFDNADHGVHMTTETLNTRFYNLRNRNNCADPAGSCGEFRTYSGAGNVDRNARFEPIP